MQKSRLYDVLLPRFKVVALILTVLGFIAKWNILSGGDVMLIFGLSILSAIHFISAFAPRDSSVNDELNLPEKYSGQNQTQFSPTLSEPSILLDIMLPKATWISSSVVILGILFRIMIWPGAFVMLLQGLIPLVLTAIILIIKRRVTIRILWVAALGVLMLTVSSESLITQFHHDNPLLAQKLIYQLHHRPDPKGTDALENAFKRRPRSH